MNINFKFKNLDKNILKHFYPLLKEKSRFLVMKGGAGSGKSIFAVQKIILRIIAGYKTNTIHNILVIMKTASSMEDTVIKETKRWINNWGLRKIVTIKQKPSEIVFSNGSRIFFRGCDDPDKMLSMSGVTSIWIEESSRITLNDFEIINTRLRGITHTYQQIMLTFNPISKNSWIYDYFYVNMKENAFLHNSLLKDNYLLNDDTYKKEIEGFKYTNINKYKTFWLGEWGSLEGVIYDGNWDIVDSIPENYNDIIYGIDFGFNVPTAIVKVTEVDGEMYLEELLYKKGLTQSELTTELDYLIDEESKSKYYLYADNAEPGRIQEINNAGFICYSANKSVNDGLDYCKSIKLHVHKDSYNLIKELEGYSWKTDKTGKSLDEPLKMHDHLCDAFRYAIFTHYHDKGFEPGIWYY